jgi:hypothetical protein
MRTGSWDTTPMWERSHLTCSRRTSVPSSSTWPPCTSYSRCASATCQSTTPLSGNARRQGPCAPDSHVKTLLTSTPCHWYQHDTEAGL